ncbi:MAG: ABC transporter permease [Ottowia sp.]|uniref:ABC transporter permease n=1 Tax=Ottowia sp. TaxID=1898956 RepID=UPI003C7903D9
MTYLKRYGGSVYFWTVAFYLLFPLLVIAPISFGEDQLMRFPPKALSLRWYAEYFRDPQWVNATLLSGQVALSTAFLATAVGTMAALALERGQYVGLAAVRGLLTAPLVVPHIFLAVGIFVLASRLDVSGNVLILICAHTVLALPFVVMMISAPLRQVDRNLEMAARVMGAGPLRAFWVGALPSLLPSIVAAAVFSFFVSFDELVIAEFLMAGQETLPMRIWADLKLQMNPTISAVATLLILVTALALWFSEWLRRKSAGIKAASNNQEIVYES